MAKKIEYKCKFGFTRETTALVIRVANAAVLEFEGQTVSTSEFGAFIEAEYKAQSGRRMPFQSYGHARDYVIGTVGAVESEDLETITVPSIMSALTDA